MRIRVPARRAATMVEAAVVSSVLFMVILATVVGALGVFRYHQVSAVAREASRYASVHGGQYAAETGNKAASAADIYNNVCVPMGVGLNLQQANVTVSLKTYTVNANTGVATKVTQSWDSSDKYPYVVTANNGAASLTSVVVTITYTWSPEILGGSVVMSSTSEIPMSY